MTITPTMDLDQLAERMGQDASTGEARRLRQILCRSEYVITEEIPSHVWECMVAEAIDALPCE